ncbi:MAG: PQQ-like beta-propeller repeat protein [Planctomycetaceae bacterium]|nr:PQQ-like beta-propeller repeat protein [Planctomycetaceae bacterium]
MKKFAFLSTCVLALIVGSAAAQPRRIRPLMIGPAAMAPPAAKAADDAADGDSDKVEQDFPGGAALKTDAEQARLLKRAEQCVEDGRLDLAAVLWQKVLDEAGDTLMVSRVQPKQDFPSSTKLLMYSSLSEEVERTLGKLPKEALDTYRIAADGEAKAVMAAAGPDKEEEALATIVRRFFLSSHGDDAAYKLACIALDRHDFVGASRLLSRILERHPDPSIPRGDLLLRLAVASAHMEDKATAEASLTRASSAPGIRPPSELVDLVRQDVAQRAAVANAAISSASKDWHMDLGNPLRNGHMPALPEGATSRTLSELWVQDFPLAMSGQNMMNQYGMPGMGGIVVFSGRMGGQPNQPQPLSREDMVNRWRENAWRPTPQLLFDGGKVYIKSPDRLTCYSTAALDDRPVWRSLWRNQYQLDGMSQMLAMMAMNYGNMQMMSNSKPRTTAEIMLFGDRVHQSMSIAGGVIYSLEGKAISESAAAQPNAGMRQPQWGVTPRRSRGNWLTAYSAGGGKVKWTRTASDEDKEGGMDVGFLAAPVACGNLLLAPVTDGGTIWLFAMGADDGKTVWKSYLCDEPQGGASPYAPVAMAVEGREAYLTVGCGVIFAVDAVGGTVRWAIRYSRDGKPNNLMRNYGYAMMTLDLSGWDDDVVIPYGRALVVMSSDCDKLLAIDRRTGELLWESPRTSPFGPAASYCLGVNGRGLFVAGKNIVRRYDIPSGRLVWEQETGDSLGRGCVTDDAVYIPVKDSIVKFDAEKGRELAQVGVALTSDDPVGNLFSDGEKLWVVGAGRVYAMTTLEHRMSKLAEQIAAGEPEAQLNRMRLYFKQNEKEAALVDLRGAYVLFQNKLSPDESAQRLFAAMNELKLAQNEPLTALGIVTELFVTAPSPPQLAKETISKRNDVVASAMNVVRQKKLAGGTAALLAVAPLIEDDYQMLSATGAIDATATKDDIPALTEAVASGKPGLQLMTIRALARLAGDDAKQPLASLLEGGDDRVRLAAARALANAGERNMLDTFVALLDSENVRVRTRSSQSLRALTGQKIDFAPEGKAEDRAKSIAAWKEWVSAEGATAKFTLPLSDQAVALGRTLYVSQEKAPQSKVFELDHQNKEVWKKDLPGQAWGCQGLPNGNRLIAVYAHSMVIEYGADGEEVWRKEGLPGAPYSVQRLDDGTTLVACADAQQLVEIAPDGSTKSINLQGRPMSAQRLDSGNTLCALMQGNRVVEVDRAGKIVWEIRPGDGRNNPSHAVRLENGNTLVCMMGSRQVVEYDPTGKTVVWQSRGRLANVYGAQRLSDGRTIVADYQGVHEFDPSGQNEKLIVRQPNVVGLSSY